MPESLIFPAKVILYTIAAYFGVVALAVIGCVSFFVFLSLIVLFKKR